jgi:hypothetical protein
MGGGVSALGAVALGCIGEGAGGLHPHRKKRFLRPGPCAVRYAMSQRCVAND